MKVTIKSSSRSYRIPFKLNGEWRNRLGLTVAGVVFGLSIGTGLTVNAASKDRYKPGQTVYVKDCGWDCNWWPGVVVDSKLDGYYFVQFKAKGTTKANLKVEEALRARPAKNCKL